MEVKITEHAKQRAAQRATHLKENLRDAVEKSVPVGIEGYSNGFLHCPTGTIFLTKARHGTKHIVTVIPAKGFNLSTDHLVKCADCGLRYEGCDDECVWCGSSEREKETERNNCRICGEPIEFGDESRIDEHVHQSCQEEVAEMFAET